MGLTISIGQNRPQGSSVNIEEIKAEVFESMNAIQRNILNDVDHELSTIRQEVEAVKSSAGATANDPQLFFSRLSGPAEGDKEADRKATLEYLAERIKQDPNSPGLAPTFEEIIRLTNERGELASPWRDTEKPMTFLDLFALYAEATNQGLSILSNFFTERTDGLSGVFRQDLETEVQKVLRYINQNGDRITALESRHSSSANAQTYTKSDLRRDLINILTPYAPHRWLVTATEWEDKFEYFANHAKHIGIAEAMGDPLSQLLQAVTRENNPSDYGGALPDIREVVEKWGRDFAE